MRKILMTGQAGTEAVVAAVNTADLFHYISKPWSGVDLTLTVERAVETTHRQDRRRRIETFHRLCRPASCCWMSTTRGCRVGMSTEADITVLFTDIQGFSGMSERVPPQMSEVPQPRAGALVPVIESRWHRRQVHR